VAQLCLHSKELLSLNTKVLIISDGTALGAHKWLEETCATFDLLLDRDRIAYDAYGLEYSLYRSWGIKTMMAYGKLLFGGTKWRGIQGDSGQLGGDVVVDKDGIIQMICRSHDPTDRPGFEQILDVLKGSKT
jgi:hypothetical protein